jgi:phenylacetate-coenzyme A ligase PaaK-like adenylate-forming protein
MEWSQLTKLSKQEIKALQNKKLKYFMRHQLPYSPYYRELFKKNNLKFEEIETVDDLQKIPFTTKMDLAPTEEDRGRPRQFILQPDEHLIKKYASKKELIKILWGKITKQDVKKELEWQYKPIHIHFTTGRTALPTPFTYSARDLEILKESGERMLNTAGISRDETALNGFPYSPHLAFWLCFFALTKIGITSLQTGGGKIMGSQKIMDAIERMKMTMLIFIPGYCYHLLREAAAQKRDFSLVKYVITGGERIGQGMKDKIRELLEQMGAKMPQTYATYAMTEGKTAWIQCAETTGYHLYPDLEFFEVIDKDGNRVKEGEGGELVYTALDWRGSVVIRYKTGDLCQGINYDPCPHCGRTVPQIFPDIQRVSEMKEFHLTKVKGELINLNNIYPLLSGMKELEEWRIEIRKKNNDPYEIDEMLLFVAPKKGIDWDKFKPQLEKQFRNEVFVSPDIKKEEVETILHKIGMETELKEKRISDLRPK